MTKNKKHTPKDKSHVRDTFPELASKPRNPVPLLRGLSYAHQQEKENDRQRGHSASFSARAISHRKRALSHPQSRHKTSSELSAQMIELFLQLEQASSQSAQFTDVLDALLLFANECDFRALETSRFFLLKHGFSSPLMNEVITAMSASLIEQYKDHQSTQASIGKHLQARCEKEANTSRKQAPALPVKSDRPSRHTLLEHLWKISYSSMDYKQLYHLALGLRHSHSLQELLLCFEQLYPHMDNNQRITNQTVVFHMLGLTKDVPSGAEKIAWKRYVKACEKSKRKHRCFAHERLQDMRRCLADKGMLSQSVLWQNVQTLQNWMQQRNAQFKHDDFDRSLQLCLTAKGEYRQQLLTLVVREIGTLSKRLYQNLVLSDLTQEGGGTAVQEYIALNDRLVQYLIDFILRQPSDKAGHAIELLLDISDAFIVAEGEATYADLNSLFVFSACLDTPEISRLHNYTKQLSRHQKKLLSELGKLCSPIENFSGLRKIAREIPNHLPFIGSVSRDLVFAKDGNKGLGRYESFGISLENTVRAQHTVAFEPCTSLTDLPEMLQHFKPRSDDALSIDSYRLYPNSTCKVSLSKHYNNLEDVLTSIDKAISLHRIPFFKLGRKTYPPSYEGIQKYFAWIHKALKKQQEQAVLYIHDAQSDAETSLHVRAHAIGQRLSALSKKYGYKETCLFAPQEWILHAQSMYRININECSPLALILELESARALQMLPTLIYKKRSYGVDAYHEVLWKHFTAWVNAQTTESNRLPLVLDSVYHRIHAFCSETEHLLSTMPQTNPPRQPQVTSSIALHEAKQAIKAYKARMKRTEYKGDPLYYHPCVLFQPGPPVIHQPGNHAKADTRPPPPCEEDAPSQSDGWVPQAFYQS